MKKIMFTLILIFCFVSIAHSGRVYKTVSEMNAGKASIVTRNGQRVVLSDITFSSSISDTVRGTLTFLYAGGSVTVPIDSIRHMLLTEDKKPAGIWYATVIVVFKDGTSDTFRIKLRPSAGHFNYVRGESKYGKFNIRLYKVRAISFVDDYRWSIPDSRWQRRQPDGQWSN